MVRSGPQLTERAAVYGEILEAPNASASGGSDPAAGRTFVTSRAKFVA